MLVHYCRPTYAQMFTIHMQEWTFGRVNGELRYCFIYISTVFIFNNKLTMFDLLYMETNLDT